jgi:hypothetical protein
MTDNFSASFGKSGVLITVLFLELEVRGRREIL